MRPRNRGPHAAHAAAADAATHAIARGHRGGLAPASFMPAGRVVSGSASTSAATVQTFLDSPLGFRLETDGVAGVDEAVTLRNTSTRSLGVGGTGVTIP